MRREDELRDTLDGARSSPRACSAVRRAAAARRAGLRRRVGAVRHRLRHAVPRRRAAALRVGDRGRRRAAPSALLVDARAVPHGARHLVPRSLGGSVQQRLPAHAVADRDRPRRMVRRRAWARACRSSSICPRRTPTSCSPCWPRSSGWSAWSLTLALFLALVWRSFWIARLASRRRAQVPVVPRRGLRPVARRRRRSSTSA